MRDVLEQIVPWCEAQRPFALATVVCTWQSAPRLPGASMAVTEDGEVVGSVSGGCVEGAVVDLAQRVLRTGAPALETYGVSDDDAFAVGLTCGGTLEVLAERIDQSSFSALGSLHSHVTERRAIAVVTVIEVGGTSGQEVRGASTQTGTAPGMHLMVGADHSSGTLGDPTLDRQMADRAREHLERGQSGVILTRSSPHDDAPGNDVGHTRGDDSGGWARVFVESFLPPPTMYVYGANDFAGALIHSAKLLGYRVVLCDARPLFTTPRRFPDADEVIVAWPHKHLALALARGAVDGRSVICVLTHDTKFDVPLLTLALSTSVAYVGAMGSRSTHDLRLAQLREQGVPQQGLDRLHSPIGLDLGAQSPEETAVSITAEILASAAGASGVSLRQLKGAIHQ